MKVRVLFLVGMLFISLSAALHFLLQSPVKPGLASPVEQSEARTSAKQKTVPVAAHPNTEVPVIQDGPFEAQRPSESLFNLLKTLQANNRLLAENYKEIRVQQPGFESPRVVAAKRRTLAS